MLSCTYVLRSELWTLESTKVDGSEGDENDVAQRTKYRGIVASILTAFTYFGTVNSSLDKFGKIDPATSTVLHRAVHPHAQIETPRTHCVVAIIWKRPVRTVFCRHKDRSERQGRAVLLLKVDTRILQVAVDVSSTRRESLRNVAGCVVNLHVVR